VDCGGMRMNTVEYHIPIDHDHSVYHLMNLCCRQRVTLVSAFRSVMKDSVAVLFLLVKLTLLAAVSSHQAVNPLKDAASSEHMHHHPHPHQEKEQQRAAPPPPAGHHPHGFDRNAVQNQQ